MRLFGCTRVVFNDALRARKAAREAGLPYVTDAELSARLAATKKTPDRAWLSEVSAVPLQQSLADLNVAYKNFFDSVTGTRKGPKMGSPRLRSRKDRRQAARFTANAKFKILPDGSLRLPKIGNVEVRWSRSLPSAPSSVTVIKDLAGRYFASFVVETDPAADAERIPPTDSEVGIDLGLTAFAVLSDGTAIRSPKFLRRAERKLKRTQRSHSRKIKGSKNKERSRVRLARAHTRVASRRADFCNKFSTQIIRDNQAVYVEDLCVVGLARTRLAKSIHDAGWSGPIRAHQPDVLDLRGEGRPQDAKCPGVGMHGVWHRPRPGSQRGKEHPRPGTQGEGKRLWRRCKTRDGPRSR
jgi:putative transposase